MVFPMPFKPTARFIADAAVGFALFTGLAVLIGGPSAAGAVFVGGAQAAGLALHAQSGPSGAMVSGPAAQLPELTFALAVIFSVLFSLNFAFVRHLKRAHVAAKRTGHHIPAGPAD
jgi:hypothetical protein